MAAEAVMQTYRGSILGLVLSLAGAAFAADNVSAQPATAEAEMQKKPAWAGLWLGRGATFEKVIDDPMRKMTRSSESNFWFIVQPDGTVKGEGTIAYQASLQKMKFKVPTPQGSIDAEVSGDSPKRYFRFGVSGSVIDTETGELPVSSDREAPHDGPITLELLATGIGEDGEREVEENATIPGITYEFKLTASVVVPGMMMGVPEATPGLDHSISGKGWSPFQGAKPQADRGPGEPHRVVVRMEFENGSFVFWDATQQVNPDDTNAFIDRLRRLENRTRSDIDDLRQRLAQEMERTARLTSDLQAQRRQAEALAAEVDQLAARIQEIAEQPAAQPTESGASQ